MKSTILLIIALILSVNIFSQEEKSLPGQDLMDRAEVYYEKGDHENAFKLFEEAAGLGNIKAMCNIGISYMTGEGVSVNCELAFEWVTKSADAGYDYAQFVLARMYRDGLCGLAEDHQKALQLFEKAAIQGLPEAQIAFGEYYSLGYLVSENDSIALHWFTKAYEAGEPDAAYYLGVCYENGFGVTQDYKKAFEIYTKGANQGSAMAQYNLGSLYFLGGEHAPKNEELALNWFEKSAEQGYMIAQYNLGIFYRDGLGNLQKDFNKAIDWMKKSAEQGFADAQFILGTFYAFGFGTEVDLVQAYDWFLKSAQQGFAQAQYNVGIYYLDGIEDISKDREIALEWFQKAAVQGDQDAIHMIEKMKAEEQK